MANLAIVTGSPGPDVVAWQPAGTLVAPGEVNVEAAVRRPDNRAYCVEEAGALQAVERRVSVAGAAVVIDIKWYTSPMIV
jgi:hypothetical protein